MQTQSEVDAYIDSLEPDRREAIHAIREAVLTSLDDGFQEMFDYGMIVYAVPLDRFPDTYNGRPLMYAALASQKRHISLYLMGIYGDESTASWFQQAYEQTGKRLDMGKSCVRFRKLEDVPLHLVGEAIARFNVDEFTAMMEQARNRKS